MWGWVGVGSISRVLASGFEWDDPSKYFIIK